MLRGMEGKWLKMASERRTDYKKYSYTGCDGFARYSERVFGLTGKWGAGILAEVLSVRAG